MWLLMNFVVNKPAKFGHSFSATYCTCTNYTRCYFKFALVYKMLFPFRCLRLEKFKVKKCLSRRIRAIFRPRSWQKLRQEWGVLAVEIPVSAAEMVLTLELHLERDKSGDVGKFHDTYIIHISTTHDQTWSHAINFQSNFSLPFVVWNFPFQFVHYGKQGLDTFDDGYVDGINLLRLNQDVSSKKMQAFVNIHWIRI